MEKQYGTRNGHSKWTHPVYGNTDRISQPIGGGLDGGAPGKRRPGSTAALSTL